MSRAVHRLFGTFGAVVLLSVFLSIGPSALAATTTYTITMGAGFGTGSHCNQQTGKGCTAFAETFRFMPNSIKVAKGDVLQFTQGGFHTATALPSNTDVSSWAEDNATGTGEPWNLVSPDPDADQPGVSADYKFNNAVFFPTDPSCGSSSSPCSVDGKGVVNSGLPLGPPTDWFTTIDAPVGDTIWFLCLVHPHMRLRVQVVNSGATDPATIAPATQTQIAADVDTANAIDNEMRTRQSKHVTANGTTVWDAWAGFDTHYIGLDAMYPRKLHLHKGDRVRWHLEELVNNDHSVTFPKKTANNLANNGLVPSCDPDGDSGPGPDTQPTSPNPPFCTDPTQLELDFTNQAALPAGNGAVTTATDFESSGIETGGGNLPTAQAPHTVRFTKLSPKGGFTYACNIHGGGMSGKVFVT